MSDPQWTPIGGSLLRMVGGGLVSYDRPTGEYLIVSWPDPMGGYARDAMVDFVAAGWVETTPVGGGRPPMRLTERGRVAHAEWDTQYPEDDDDE